MGSNVCEAAASPACWSHYVQRSLCTARPLCIAPLMHSAPYVQRCLCTPLPMYSAASDDAAYDGPAYDCAIGGTAPSQSRSMAVAYYGGGRRGPLSLLSPRPIRP